MTSMSDNDYCRTASYVVVRAIRCNHDAIPPHVSPVTHVTLGKTAQWAGIAWHHSGITPFITALSEPLHRH